METLVWRAVARLVEETRRIQDPVQLEEIGIQSSLQVMISVTGLESDIHKVH